MSEWGLAVVAAALFSYALVSRRLSGTVITSAMVFVAIGLAVGPDALGALDISARSQLVTVLVNATLTVVLFVDASRIHLRALRREYAVPVRLLGIGLPLTIAAGTLGALWLFDGLAFWPAALLATILAPTDAALGQAVVSSPTLPTRISQGLNVESGLNDGVCVPLITICTTLAVSAEGLEHGPLRIVAEEIGFGIVGGVLAGLMGTLLLRDADRRGWLEAGWRQIAVLAIPVAAYGVAVGLHGSGFIAAFVAGMVFAAVGHAQPLETPLADEVGELLGGLTILVFGAAVLEPALHHVTAEVIVYAVLSLTVIRIVPVAICLLGSHARPPTIAFLGWFGPRGLASIVFAMGLAAEPELVGRTLIVEVAAVTVGLSILLHGLSAAPAADRYSAWYRTHPSQASLMESKPDGEAAQPR
jgi:sodium/hydrogen antiporter